MCQPSSVIFQSLFSNCSVSYLDVCPSGTLWAVVLLIFPSDITFHFIAFSWNSCRVQAPWFFPLTDLRSRPTDPQGIAVAATPASALSVQILLKASSIQWIYLGLQLGIFVFFLFLIGPQHKSQHPTNSPSRWTQHACLTKSVTLKPAAHCCWF